MENVITGNAICGGTETRSIYQAFRARVLWKIVQRSRISDIKCALFCITGSFDTAKLIRKRTSVNKVVSMNTNVIW